MRPPFPAYRGTDPFIFVSYSHRDADRVFPRIQQLADEGVNVWYDEGITPGEEWTAELAQAIRDATHFLFFITPNSADSKHCRDEVQFARKHDKQLVLVHLIETKLPDSLELSLGSTQAIIAPNLSPEAFDEKLWEALSRSGPAPNFGSGNVPARSSILKYAAVAAAALAVGIAVLFWPASDEAGRQTAAPPPVIPGFSGRAAIAVLPFVNVSNDPAQEYFADGITEDLITGLQSFQSFPIIARTSTFQYKHKTTDIRDIAAALGAGYVIEGSVRKAGERVRINAQLINHQGTHVWADNYDFELQDVLQVQAQLVDRILHAIEPELIISEADRSRFVRTEDMEAFDYYLQATTNTFAPFGFTDLNGESVSAERLETARELAHNALQLDPDFAAAYRLLNHIDGSYLVNLRHLLTDVEAEETLRRSIAAGEKSRQLSPFEPTVCSCLAAMLLMSGDVDGAALLQEESLLQNPAEAGVHAVMAKILQVKGDQERALREIQLAKRLSPEDMAMTTFAYFEAAILQASGRFDDAVAAANRSLLLSPANFDARYVQILSLLAGGDEQAARRAVQKLRESASPGFNPKSGWTEAFPVAVAENVTLASGEPLGGREFNDGLAMVLQELGWDS